MTESSGAWAPGVQASLPADASGTWVSLASVSCAAAGDCNAVGSYTDSSLAGQGVLLTESSGTWAPRVGANVPANAAGSVGLVSVSCASAGDCTAVGTYAGGAGGAQGLLLTESSGAWAPGVEAILPANAASTVPLAGSATATGKGVKLQLECSGSAGQSCRTTDTLTTTETLEGGRPIAVAAAHKPKKPKRTVVVVGGERAAIAAGGTDTITIPLNTHGRRLLKQFQALPVTVTVMLTINGKATVAVDQRLIIATPVPRSVTRRLMGYLQVRFVGVGGPPLPISLTCTRATASRYNCSWSVGAPGDYRDDSGGRAEVIARGRKLLVRHVVIECAPDGQHDLCYPATIIGMAKRGGSADVATIETKGKVGAVYSSHVLRRF